MVSHNYGDQWKIEMTCENLKTKHERCQEHDVDDEIEKMINRYEYRYLISHERVRPRHVFKKCLDQLF